MFDKRLMKEITESRRYIIGNVVLQWLGLCVNVLMMYAIAFLITAVWSGFTNGYVLAVCGMIALGALPARWIITRAAAYMSFQAGRTVKKTLRRRIWQKLLHLGSTYAEQTRTAELVQTSVEGVDQLETYFGAYLPQLFYAVLAPVTLFLVLVWFDWRPALVLLVCVPMIPMAIIAVQKWAKKLLSKYWGQYTEMGDSFLENLQGMTTLKIYQADAARNVKMNEEAEKFRKMTMRVLIMQLNSISIMDLVAYTGAALGMLVGILCYRSGSLSLTGCLLVILLSAEFFLPMRTLGSYFHVAMNGMAAADRIFAFLDLEEKEKGTRSDLDGCSIVLQDVSFGYSDEREVLHHITMHIPEHSFTAIVGESGSGKSTIAHLLMKQRTCENGTITLGGVPVGEVAEDTLFDTITCITDRSYLFKGTLRENLCMAKENASEEELWDVLKRVHLEDFAAERGLDTEIHEEGKNLSGGQRQRLALARGLLHDTPVYIFDEASSNIDRESEAMILEEILHMRKTKTILMITHRMHNCKEADAIYVLKDGEIIESGTHASLCEADGLYKEMLMQQSALEQYAGGTYEA